MTILSSGNVGIGTTAPGQKLTVVGTIESTLGGIKFPDGTIQATAASAGLNGGGTVNYIGKFTGTGTIGNVTGTGPFAGSAGFFEGTGTAGLVPASLYNEQLAQRQPLATDIEPELPDLHADRRALLQVLVNLLANAVKFTPEGGRIRLTVKLHPSGGLAFIVSDTGIGIAAEDLPRVLEPFGQVNNSADSSGP